MDAEKEARDLLRAYREANEPSAQRKAAAWAAIAALSAAGGAAGSAAAGAAAAGNTGAAVSSGSATAPASGVLEAATSSSAAGVLAWTSGPWTKVALAGLALAIAGGGTFWLAARGVRREDTAASAGIAAQSIGEASQRDAIETSAPSPRPEQTPASSMRVEATPAPFMRVEAEATSAPSMRVEATSAPEHGAMGTENEGIGAREGIGSPLAPLGQALGSARSTRTERIMPIAVRPRAPRRAEPIPISPAAAQPEVAAAAAPPTGSLAEEYALIRAAQRALGAGDARTALARLDEHAARFAQGALANERRIARVAALCEAGREAEARAEAAGGSSPAIARALSRCPAR